MLVRKVRPKVVTMRQEDRDPLLGFEAAVARVPEVVQRLNSTLVTKHVVNDRPLPT